MTLLNLSTFYRFLLVIVLFCCTSFLYEGNIYTTNVPEQAPYLMVLGIAQDAGYPQAGCAKNCCKRTWSNQENKRLVSCIALIDPSTNEKWIFDATPDFPEQLHILGDSVVSNKNLRGVFLTHAHIGHYTGLMHLGREVMGAKEIPVYAMPRMSQFLKQNGPWNQLVSLKNIMLHSLKADSTIKLNDRITITPFIVPHRDEFSETVGYKIKGPNKSAIFIPDIDKWEKWDKKIRELIPQNDVLFLDGTFFKEGELAGRTMSEVPHPFVEESMKLFGDLSKEERQKINFIHFNHTNPLLIEGSNACKQVQEKGYNVAKQKQVVVL